MVDKNKIDKNNLRQHMLSLSLALSPVSLTFRVVGSRVANSMFSAMTPARVRLLSSVDFPALV